MSGSLRTRQHRVRARSRRLFLEQLEARQLLAVLIPPDLVSWYRGESNANDSADSNNGTLVGGTAFAAGEVGQAFSFDGINDEVSIPNAANLNLTTQLSLEAWVFPTATSGG